MNKTKNHRLFTAKILVATQTNWECARLTKNIQSFISIHN